MTILLTDFNFTEGLFYLLGGLGIFLFGINLMGDSLKALAGSRMKTIIEKTTDTPLKGIFIGIIVTVLLQTSSGTTALTIGLVRASLMTLPQAIGVIMGANIGTTVTSFMVGLKISEYALPIIGVGSLTIFFTRRKKHRNLGGAILGFGMLFFGLELMGTGLKPLSKTPEAIELFKLLATNPFLGVFFGTIATAIVQSSSAAIGILQKLYESDAILLAGALPILIGSNIGTTITAILAAIGGTTAAKRAAVVHVAFNVAGAVMFMILLYPAYIPAVNFVEDTFLTGLGEHPMMTIAIAHMIFNFTTTFVMFFFIKQMVWLSKKVIPGDDFSSFQVELIDDALIEESPTLALEFVRKTLVHMGDVTFNYFKIVREYSFKEIPKYVSEGDELEKAIDDLDKRIHDYLIKISQSNITPQESTLLSRDLDTIRDLERIGDHLTNILGFFEERHASKYELSVDAVEDMTHIYDALERMLKDALEAFKNNDKTLARQVSAREDLIDSLEERYRYRHIDRLKSGECTVANADNYVDILANMERIGDHCDNIARNVIQPVRVLPEGSA